MIKRGTVVPKRGTIMSKIPTKKQILKVLEDTDCGVFLTVCEKKKKYITMEMEDLFDAIKIYQTQQAANIRAYLKKGEK